MREQLDILQSRLGVRPAGYRSPSWDVNVWTPDLLKRHGFLYDSSLMGNDVPYEIDTGEGPLIEVPVQWLLDDAPLFRHVYGATNAIADPGRVSASTVSSACSISCGSRRRSTSRAGRWRTTARSP